MAETQAPPTPGTFCWNELMTRDVAVAKSVFGTLFGWQAEDVDMGPMGTYTVFKVGEKMVAGSMPMGKEFEGLPVHWMGYVWVDDADASVKQAESLGVKVCVQPTEIPNVGRFAVLEHAALGTFSILGPSKA